MRDIKTRIFGIIDDGIADLLYYDRKEDEDLPVGAIEQVITDGVLTVDEIVGKFRSALEAGLAR